MKEIYRKHQTNNGVNYSYWDDVYYLCSTEEEYQKALADYKARQEFTKVDYAKRGYAQYTPTLSKEGEIHASEYYYAHEWTGKNFDAYDFSYTIRDNIGSTTTYILKPNSVAGLTPTDNSGCVGWMYGS